MIIRETHLARPENALRALQQWRLPGELIWRHLVPGDPTSALDAQTSFRGARLASKAPHSGWSRSDMKLGSPAIIMTLGSWVATASASKRIAFSRRLQRAATIAST